MKRYKVHVRPWTYSSEGYVVFRWTVTDPVKDPHLRIVATGKAGDFSTAKGDAQEFIDALNDPDLTIKYVYPPLP